MRRSLRLVKYPERVSPFAVLPVVAEKHAIGSEPGSPISDPCIHPHSASQPFPLPSNSILDSLHDPSFPRDCASYSSLLRSCSLTKSLSDGHHVHDHILRAGLEENVYLHNLIMDMYGRCDVSMSSAFGLFARMADPDIFSWNFIIRAHTHHGLYEEALQLFDRMLSQATILPDEYIYVSVLSVCSTTKALARGKLLHIIISLNGLLWEVIVATALINMYAKCGSLNDAWKVFGGISNRDIVAWNTIIGACVLHDNGKDALKLFKQLHQEGAVPNRTTLSTMLDVCIIDGAQALGEHIHACIANSDLGSDIAMRMALSNMYSKCAGMKDVLPDSLLPASRTQNGLVDAVVDAFGEIQRKGVLPERYAFVSMISACSCEAAFTEGENMHAYIAGSRLEVDLLVGTALINMYGRGRKVDLAQALFDKMPVHDIISWTAMISAYAQNKQGEKACEHFEKMKLNGITPNEVTFAAIFDACNTEALLPYCKNVHQDILGSEMELDLFVGTSIINMYGRLHCLEDAEKMFDKLPVHDEITWNAMIAASVHNGEGKRALQIFKEMQEHGMIPGKVTFVSTCNACAIHLVLTEGKKLHTRIIANKLEYDVVLRTALIDIYGRYGCLEDAMRIFDATLRKDVVSWTAIMAAYAHHGQIKKAFKLFDEMLLAGLQPDNVSCISLLSACVSKTGIDDGRLMHMRVIFCALDLDISVMNGLIIMYGKCGSMHDALRTFEKISENSHATFVSILSACSNQANFVEGRKIHERVLKTGFEMEVSVGNALINMYSKCGSLQEAVQLFNMMSARDIVSWTMMISLHAQHGHGEVALDLFDKMRKEGFLPNEVTFVNILNAFSHSGMVDEGFQCFGHLSYGLNSMSPIEDHYNCIIDLLGRAGRLGEVEKLIQAMPLTPSVVTWTSFLNACRQHLDLERGEHAAREIFRMEPTDPAPYLTLYNLYIAAGRFQDAEKAMYKWRERNLPETSNIECVTSNSEAVYL